MAETGVGASLWASGNQVCTGKSPTFVPKPTTASTKASRTAVADRCGATANSGVNARSYDCPRTWAPA